MDYDLTDYMKYLQQKEGRRPREDEIKFIMKQVLQSIEYIHSWGFLHRDLKPENFIIQTST